MLRHVPAIRAWIAFAAEHVQEDVAYGHSKRVCDRFLAIIGEEPVVARPHQHHRSDLDLFVAARGCEKRNLSLPR